MDRYIAFLWEKDRQAFAGQVARWVSDLRTQSSGWAEVFCADGLVVCALPDSRGILPVCGLTPSSGVIVGSLFQKRQEARGALRDLTAEATTQILESRGHALIHDFWGSYVAFLRPDGSEDIIIVRDPCGATPCYRIQVRGVTVLASYVEDVARLSGVVTSIDWEAVAAYLVSNYLINARTGLREISEILPGQRLTWRPGAPATTTSLWNPVAIASAADDHPFDQICEAFRSTSERCVSAWAAGRENMLLRMSGGLDSSVVAGLTRRAASGRVTGLHFVGRGYEGYEAELARAVASRLDIHLIEETFDARPLDFRSALSAPRLARPAKQLLGLSADAKLEAACETTNADLIMSGHGGDAVFLQRSIAGDVLVDYLAANGPGRKFVSVAYDTATLLETSIWHVFGNAAAHLVGRRKWDPQAAIRDGSANARHDFASDAFFALGDRAHTSEWLDEARHLPPAKAEQLRNLLALRDYHSSLGHALNRRSVHPLISQPLIELALRTPAYLFNAGGTDRALERKAFADVIPDAVARRVHKGFVNHSVIASIAADIDYIRSLVLEGRLMDSGLLDRGKVATLLSQESLLEGKSLGSVLDLVAVESWLTTWLR